MRDTQITHSADTARRKEVRALLRLHPGEQRFWLCLLLSLVLLLLVVLRNLPGIRDWSVWQ